MADATTLNGHPSSYFATADHTHDYKVKTSAYTAVNGDKLTVSAGVTITLPNNPSPGHIVYFAVGGDWESSNMTVNRNGENIMGVASDLAANINEPFALAYQNAIRGWVLAE